MTDTKTKEERSRNMSAIKSKDTKPEVYIRKLLFGQGYRYRKNSKQIPGHPDIWMRKYNTAIFVNGCFWHRHQGCKYSYMPKSRTEYWKNKFDNNTKRDHENRKLLFDKGIKCLVLWECSINNKRENPSEKLLKEIIDFLHSNDLYKEI